MQEVIMPIEAAALGTVAVIPICVAMVQALKMTGWIQDRFAPLVSIAVGILIAFIAYHDNPDWTATILNGVIVGLSSSGLYSGVKETANHMKYERKSAQPGERKEKK